jgi:hypothetical protein
VVKVEVAASLLKLLSKSQLLSQAKTVMEWRRARSVRQIRSPWQSFPVEEGQICRSNRRGTDLSKSPMERVRSAEVTGRGGWRWQVRVCLYFKMERRERR